MRLMIGFMIASDRTALYLAPFQRVIDPGRSGKGRQFPEMLREEIIDGNAVLRPVALQLVRDSLDCLIEFGITVRQAQFLF